MYLYDEDKEFMHRLMIFKPKTPGVFTEYEYGGELLKGPLASHDPRRPVLDDAGNIYTREEDAVEEHSSTGTLLCEFKEPKGGITGFTVNPITGEPFYYSYKDRKVHQLEACSGGKFAPAAGGEFSAVPTRGDLEAMAFNPELEWETGRAGGTLYAGAPKECPAIGSCPPESAGQSALGYIFAQPLELEPIVESESVSKVRPTSATLNAMVNPKGATTTYAFQYMTRAAYEEEGETFAGALEAPIGGAGLGAGQEGVLASITVSGLAPNTEYVYKVTATSVNGSDEGPVQSFRTFAPAAGTLVDNRAYELVSPVQKNGGEVIPGNPSVGSCGGECKPGGAGNRFPALAGPGGNSVSYQSSPFVFNEGALEYDQQVSTRTASGWQTTSLSPPMAGDPGGAGFQSFSLNGGLGQAIVYARNQALVPEAPAGYLNFFLEQTGNRFGLSPLITNANATIHRQPGEGLEGLKLTYAGASSDYSRQFFEANDGLSPEALDGGAAKNNLYEWSGGQLHAVNLLPGATESTPGAAFGSGFLLGSPIPPTANFSHAISSDGSRLYWTGADGKTYARLGANLTFEVPGPGTCKESVAIGSRVCFLTASADGSRVLLSSGKLFELNEGAETFEQIADLGEGLPGFQGIAGQSEDLSHLYFVDTTVLAGEETNSAGDKAQAGKPNLYAWQEGAATKFVATLLASDNGPLGVWSAAPVRRSAEASPNGRWLAFNSEAELTGVNSIGSCVFDAKQGKWVLPGPCQEVFLYDSQTGQLSCPSCNPTGAAPLGSSIMRTELHAEAALPQPRYLTDSGRLYFDSRDALSALDTNNGVEDVYQFEPQGVGSCVTAGGCVSLISSGSDAYDANFLTMDASGGNVFFTTRNQLLPADVDQLIDLYDARVGGGIAEPEPQPPCQGDGCQPPTPPVPARPLLGSSSFEGPGNAKPKKQNNNKQKNKQKKHKKKNKKKQTKSKRGGS
ncbi:MAG TPA: fibronectin type III domain-containing protein, partial [Solirubrobacterales bacterium]|nr:fibronectin type III domain-containing protein [Solirubrobacterales bacterium]